MPRTKVLWIKDEHLHQILSGRKTIEVRVAYSNIQRLQPGDVLNLNDRYPYVIVDVRRYADFQAMLEAEDPNKIAPDLGDHQQAILSACREIYPADKESLGVIVLEIAAMDGAGDIHN